MCTNIVYVDRLGSTCNDVAALLFKVDYAWQQGLMEGCCKPCTSGENRWISPCLVSVDLVMAWCCRTLASVWKPPNPAVRESATVRSLFLPVRSRQDAQPCMVEDIAAAVYPECSDGVVFRSTSKLWKST